MNAATWDERTKNKRITKVKEKKKKARKSGEG